MNSTLLASQIDSALTITAGSGMELKSIFQIPGLDLAATSMSVSTRGPVPDASLIQQALSPNPKTSSNPNPNPDPRRNTNRDLQPNPNPNHLFNRLCHKLNGSQWCGQPGGLCRGRMMS